MNRLFLFIIIAFAVVQSSCASFIIGGASVNKDKGTFEVTSSPPGADVVLNDKVVGQTPCKVVFKGKSEQAINEQENMLIVRKNGYKEQDFTLQPSKKDTSYANGQLFLSGLGEFLLGCTAIVLGAGIKEPSTDKTSTGGNVVAYTGLALLISGAVDMKVSRTSRLGRVVKRTYTNNLNTNLESNEAYEKRQEDERIAAEKERIAREEARRKEQEAWEADRPAREAAERARQENERKRIEAVERAKQLAQAQAREALKTLKQGEKICAMETNCYRGDDCLAVSAYVEDWNPDKSKYKLRIHSVNTGSTTYTDGSGRQYGIVDNVRYNVGDIMWVDFFERSGTTWVICHSK